MSFYLTINMGDADDTCMHFYNFKVHQEIVPNMIVLQSWAGGAVKYIQFPPFEPCATQEARARLEKKFEVLSPLEGKDR